MTHYLDSYDTYETPLHYQSSDLIVEHGSVDSVRQIQVRMVLLFGIALMIASALSLLALPIQAGAGSGGSASTSTDVIMTTSVQVDQAAIQNVTALAGAGIADLFTPEVKHWETEIVSWANQHDVDPNAVATIMQIESCGDPQAVSVAGARGLFQVMPFHFSADENMLDPDTNARRGLNFLNEQLRYTGGDIFLSFAGYNGGYAASGGNYESWPDETKRYYQWAKGIYEDATSGASSSDTLNAWLDAGGRPGCQRAASRLGI